MLYNIIYMKHAIIIVVLLALGGASLWIGLAKNYSSNDLSDNNDGQVNIDSKEPLINIEIPEADEYIGNPALVHGEARGYWFFEGSAPVEVFDGEGRVIGEGYISAEADWMTEELVPFAGSITYDLPENSENMNGVIVFKKANPSDMPENSASVEIPVILTPGDRENSAVTAIPEDAIFCEEEQRVAEFCTEEYMPVCGFIETQCITEPCEPIKETFSNGCFACISEKNVVAYTEGECSIE